jgi:hypothetical protein
MRKLSVATATETIFALLVTPAFSAPGGGVGPVARISFMRCFGFGQDGDVDTRRSGDVRRRPGERQGCRSIQAVGGQRLHPGRRDNLWGYLPVTYSSYHVGQADPFELPSEGWTSSPLSARLSCGGCRTQHASRRRVAKPGNVVRGTDRRRADGQDTVGLRIRFVGDTHPASGSRVPGRWGGQHMRRTCFLAE